MSSGHLVLYMLDVITLHVFLAVEHLEVSILNPSFFQEHQLALLAAAKSALRSTASYLKGALQYPYQRHIICIMKK